MLYRPQKGKMWDPTVVYYKKKYYMFTMWYEEQGRESFAMRLAVSDDGVHWEDRGNVLEGGKNPVWKMNIHMLEDGRFALNHGSMSFLPGHGNDTLFYYVSDDLIHWTCTGMNHPDPEWYEEEERWDHMAVIPSEKGGYIGYAVATPKKEVGGMLGIQKSPDGINWTVCKPPEIDWDGCVPVREMEVGGCAKSGNKWYLIGGICPPFEGNYGYSCYTFTAENEEGPFKPDRKALRLCGFNGRQGDLFVQALAAFVRNYENEDLLVSNSVVYEKEDSFNTTWLVPLKKAVPDEEGHLRLKYYEANDALKGKILAHIPAMEIKSAFEEGYMLNDHFATEKPADFDPEKGCVVEGELTVTPYPDRGPVRAGCWRPTRCGFVIGEKEGKGTALLADCTCSGNRRTNIGKFEFGGEQGEQGTFYPEDSIYPGCACPTGIDTGKKHTFRLIIRYGMFEFYLDDFHVQTYTTKNMPDGRLYFSVMNGHLKLENMKLYEITL